MDDISNLIQLARYGAEESGNDEFDLALIERVEARSDALREALAGPECQEIQLDTYGDHDGPVSLYRVRGYILGHAPGEEVRLCAAHVRSAGQSITPIPLVDPLIAPRVEVTEEDRVRIVNEAHGEALAAEATRPSRTERRTGPDGSQYVMTSRLKHVSVHAAHLRGPSYFGTRSAAIHAIERGDLDPAKRYPGQDRPRPARLRREGELLDQLLQKLAEVNEIRANLVSLRGESAL